MRSLWLIRYQMRGGKIHTVPFYGPDLDSALNRFHEWMGGHGCEREKYRFLDYRQIPEKRVSFRVHGNLLRKLSRRDWLALLQDRHQRQSLTGYPDEQVLTLLNQLSPEMEVSQ